jgi:hypothetical protein
MLNLKYLREYFCYKMQGRKGKAETKTDFFITDSSCTVWNTEPTGVTVKLQTGGIQEVSA